MTTGRLRAARRVCVVTGTRAEYGLLSPLLREIERDERLALQLLVTGAHLSPEFGLTYRAIEADGFRIDEKVEMLLSGDTPVAIAKSLGLGVIGCADALGRLAPDVLVVLGDRYEVLAAVQAALVARIPVAHLHGGETTEGAIDESIRHAVTKLAQLHFVAADPYRRRVIQLGEDPAHVYDVGAIGLDAIRRSVPLDREELARELNFPLTPPTFLVTYHPATLDPRGPAPAMEALLAALDRFPDARAIVTKTNADAGGRTINAMIDAYAAQRKGRVLAVVSLGQRRYLSALRAADAVIGNSSSGIIEAPFVGTPTVNIGIRQQGRLRAPSVIDCSEDASAIEAAVRHALSAEFRARAARAESPYGRGETARRIAEILASVELDGLVTKRFHDLPAAAGGFAAPVAKTPA